MSNLSNMPSPNKLPNQSDFVQILKSLNSTGTCLPANQSDWLGDSANFSDLTSYIINSMSSTAAPASSPLDFYKLYNMYRLFGAASSQTVASTSPSPVPVSIQTPAPVTTTPACPLIPPSMFNNSDFINFMLFYQQHQQQQQMQQLEMQRSSSDAMMLFNLAAMLMGQQSTQQTQLSSFMGPAGMNPAEKRKQPHPETSIDEKSVLKTTQR